MTVGKIYLSDSQALMSSDNESHASLKVSYYDANRDGRTFKSLKMSKYKRAFL